MNTPTPMIECGEKRENPTDRVMVRFNFSSNTYKTVKLIGADPNRNFGYQWGGQGASTNACKIYLIFKVSTNS